MAAPSRHLMEASDAELEALQRRLRWPGKGDNALHQQHRRDLAEGRRLMPRSEVAAALGVSDQRIAQIEQRALKKIREALAAQGLRLDDFL